MDRLHRHVSELVQAADEKASLLRQMTKQAASLTASDETGPLFPRRPHVSCRRPPGAVCPAAVPPGTFPGLGFTNPSSTMEAVVGCSGAEPPCPRHHERGCAVHPINGRLAQGVPGDGRLSFRLPVVGSTLSLGHIWCPRSSSNCPRPGCEMVAPELTRAKNRGLTVRALCCCPSQLESPTIWVSWP